MVETEHGESIHPDDATDEQIDWAVLRLAEQGDQQRRQAALLAVWAAARRVEQRRKNALN